MRRAIVFATDALEPLVDLARRAQDAGLDRVWTTEFVGRDAVARAIAVALGTERIGVGTGIAYAFARPPLAMAALSADAQRLAGGRFALGVGSGTRGVRRWYDAGETFQRPGPDMAAYADAVREGWGRVERLGAPPELHGAALNPIMARHVARSFDGALLHPLALSRVHLRERLLPALRKGAAERDAGGGGSLAVAAWVVTSIAAERDEAVARARRQLAFYLSTPSYATVVEGTPWEHVATDVREAFDASDRKATWTSLGELVPEEVVAELALAGTAEDVRAQAGALESELSCEGVTELVFQTVGSDMTEHELVTNCEQIIDTLGGVRA